MELDSLGQAVLGCLGDNEITASEDIVKGDGCRPPGYNHHRTAFLRLVLVIGLFGHSVGAGGKIVDLDFTRRIGGNGLVDPVALNAEFDSINLAVLGGLDDFCAAIADLDIQVAGDGVADRLCVGHNILQGGFVRAIFAVRPCDNAAAAGIAFGRGDGYRAAGRFICRDGELIAVYREADTGLVCLEGIPPKDIVAVRQGRGVFFTVPFQFDVLRSAGASGKKAGSLECA